MSYFIDICSICLKYSNNLKFIRSSDTNGTSIEDKLQYLLHGFELKSNIAKYICAKCRRNVRECYDFKQKCLHNIATYDKYAQQITTKDGSYKYLYVTLSPDLNILESHTEIIESTVNSEEFIIKEEASEGLVLNDEAKSLLHEIKQEKFEFDDTCKHNENVSFSTGNETISGQDEKEVKMENHIWLHDINDEKLSNNEDSKQDVLESNIKLHKCKICNKLMKSARSLTMHHYIHTNNKPYNCKFCKKPFRLLGDLKRHQLLHTGEKPYTCEVCQKSFTQKSGLMTHRFTHSDEKPYTCEICDKSFKCPQKLKSHQLLHTNNKTYDCKFCKKSFRMLGDLKRHQLLHTGERPHVCEVCKKSFTQISGLKTHRLIHSNEKPYSCDGCDKSFKCRQNLKRHKLIHTNEKPFTCEICKKSFRRLQHLQRHQLIHTGEKPHVIKSNFSQVWG